MLLQSIPDTIPRIKLKTKSKYTGKLAEKMIQIIGPFSIIAFGHHCKEFFNSRLRPYEVQSAVSLSELRSQLTFGPISTLVGDHRGTLWCCNLFACKTNGFSLSSPLCFSKHQLRSRRFIGRTFLTVYNAPSNNIVFQPEPSLGNGILRSYRQVQKFRADNFNSGLQRWQAAIETSTLHTHNIK